MILEGGDDRRAILRRDGTPQGEVPDQGRDVREQLALAFADQPLEDTPAGRELGLRVGLGFVAGPFEDDETRRRLQSHDQEQERREEADAQAESAHGAVVPKSDCSGSGSGRAGGRGGGVSPSAITTGDDAGSSISREATSPSTRRGCRSSRR